MGDLDQLAIDDLTQRKRTSSSGSSKVARPTAIRTEGAVAAGPRAGRMDLPFPVVAEMRFGAEIAGWGPTRWGALERLVSRTAVIPPIGEVIDAYVGVRTWAARTGHGLAVKDHGADRWVAAVALAANRLLATEDSIFDGVPQLIRAQPVDLGDRGTLSRRA